MSRRSIFGALLCEDKLARFIYTDESGTSAAEPVRVVASVIVDGDTQVREATKVLHQLVQDHVPAPLKDGFIFHAKEVYGGSKKINRRDWERDERLAFLKAVLSIPRACKLPIAVGVTFKGALDHVWQPTHDVNFTSLQYEHCSTFAHCIERADSFLRKYLNNAEIGTVIAEDVPNMRRLLGEAGLMFKNYSVTFDGGLFRNLNWTF